MFTPPVRGAFFEGKVRLPMQNPNLPELELDLEFVRTSREWVAWVTNMARAVGAPIQSLSVVANINFANMAAGASDDQTVTIVGVKANDPQAVVNIGVGSFTAGLVFQGFVSADDTVTVRCTNASTGAINPVAADYRIEVRRYQ